MAKKEQEMYEGMPVIEAADQKALEKKLEKMEERPDKYVVRIGNRSTKIKYWAFENNENIAFVLISDSVTEIETGAFCGCKGLMGITIPDSVLTIGDSAFKNCSALTSVVIGKSVNEIYPNSFTDCTSLASIVVSDGNKKYDSRNNCNAIIETESNRLFFGCKNSVIPDSVTEIGYYAFMDCPNLRQFGIRNPSKNLVI